MLRTIQGPVNTPVQAENGKFDIENCTPRETRSIKKALEQGQMAVQKALADIPNGRYSRHGLGIVQEQGELFEGPADVSRPDCFEAHAKCPEKPVETSVLPCDSLHLERS